MNIFSIESPLYKFLLRFWDMVKLNFCWLLFSLPIVTMGAATVAAYSVTLKMVDEHEGYVIRQFVKAFKENWKQGIPMGIITMVSIYIVYLNSEIFNKVESNPTLFLIAAVLVGFVSLLSFTYAFPLSARYHNTLWRTFKNSFDISIRYFPRTLFLWVVLAVEIALFLFNNITLFFGILMGPACIILTVSGFALRAFREIEKEPGAVTNTENTEE